ncbi:hypothetical protein, partial [Pseudomonas aeruginosa]
PNQLQCVSSSLSRQTDTSCLIEETRCGESPLQPSSRRRFAARLNSGVSTTETLLYFAHVYSNGIQFLKRCAALGLPFLWASPGGVTLVCGLFGLWPLCSKREQLFFS